jgi:hypothetical protein
MTPQRLPHAGHLGPCLSLHGGDGRSIVSAVLLGVALSGCSSSSSPSSPTATSLTANGPAAVVVSPTHAPTRAAFRPHSPPRRPATIALDRGFSRTVRTVCAALTRKDASTVTRDLPYYQYNSGLRYGTLGDGEGQNGDPRLMASWLAHAHVRCTFQSSGSHGHGVVLATGWPQHGGTALIELDVYAGRWKINDLTFGRYGALYRAMRTAGPVVRYPP